MHVRIGLASPCTRPPTTLPASHTRPRSLRSRSMSITCSARSFGMRDELGGFTFVPLARRVSRTRARDRARRDVATLYPQETLGRRGEDRHVAKLHAGRERRWIRAPQRRVDAGGRRSRAQADPPGTREIRLIHVARRDVFLNPPDALEEQSRRLLVESLDRDRGAVLRRQRCVRREIRRGSVVVRGRVGTLPKPRTRAPSRARARRSVRCAARMP